MGLIFIGTQVSSFKPQVANWIDRAVTVLSGFLDSAMSFPVASGGSPSISWDDQAPLTVSFTEKTTVGFGLYDVMRNGGGSWGQADRRIWALTSGGSHRLAVADRDTGNPVLVKYDGATETVLATLNAKPSDGDHRWDVHVADYGATATVRVWCDQVLLANYSGDISIGGCTGYDGLSLKLTAGYYRDLAGVVVADEATCRIMPVRRTVGSVDTNTFTSGTYTDVDETVTNTNDYIRSDTADQVFLGGLASSIPTGPYTIIGAKIVAVASKGTSGPTTLKIGFKKDGGSEDWDAGTALAENWDAYQRTVLPAEVTFTQAEINAFHIGVKSAT